MTIAQIVAMAEWCLPYHEPRIGQLNILGTRDHDERCPPHSVLEECECSTEGDVYFCISEIVKQLPTGEAFFVSGPPPGLQNVPSVTHKGLTLYFAQHYDPSKAGPGLSVGCWYYPA